MIAWSEKFKFEQVEAAQAPRSPIFDWLWHSGLLSGVRRCVAMVWQRADVRVSGRRLRPPEPQARCLRRLQRRILVDAARARGSHKHGAGPAMVNVEEVAILSPEPHESIVALHDSLEEFSKTAPRQAKVVEFRYFGGMTRVSPTLQFFEATTP